MFNSQHIYLFGQIQTSQSGGKLDSYTSPYEVSECSLTRYTSTCMSKSVASAALVSLPSWMAELTVRACGNGLTFPDGWITMKIMFLSGSNILPEKI